MINPPPPDAVLVFHVVYDITVEWYGVAKQFPKRDRYILGEKVFIELLECLHAVNRARYSTNNRKVQHLYSAITAMNNATILVRLANSLEILPDKRYFALSEKFINVGKQLGGWLKYCQSPQPIPPQYSGK